MAASVRVSYGIDAPGVTYALLGGVLAGCRDVTVSGLDWRMYPPVRIVTASRP